MARGDATAATTVLDSSFRSIVDAATQGIYVHRGDRLLYANPAAARLLGYANTSDLLATTPVDRVYPDDLERVAGYARARQRGEPAPDRYLGRLLRADGKVVWAECSVAVVPWHDGDALLFTFNDQTERKFATDALIESETRFRDFAEFSTDWLWETDVELRITWMSERFEVITGISRESILGRSRREIAEGRGELERPDTDSEALRDRLDRMDRRESYANLRYSHRHPDGSIHYWSISGKPVYDEDGRFQGYRCVSRDVSQIVAAEEALKSMNERLEARVRQRTAELQAANRELAGFSYTVSHDLRAPLRHIHGYLEMLRERTWGQLDSTARRHLTVIGEAASRMERQIEALLRHARLGRAPLNFETVALGELVTDVIAETESDPGYGPLRKRPVQWQIDALPDVRADRALLRSVVFNLIDNAVKFTRTHETPRVHVGVEETRDGEHTFFVADNGVGFEPAYSARLFGMFQRLHGVDEFEGAGTGLASVQRIIERHGGRVWADGKPNAGATVRFTLPEADRQTAAS